MLVAVNMDQRTDDVVEGAGTLDAFNERRKWRSSQLSRIAFRRIVLARPSASTSSIKSDIDRYSPHDLGAVAMTYHERPIKPEEITFDKKQGTGRRRISYSFTGVGGLLGQVATAPASAIASTSHLSVVSVVGASTVGRRMVHGERAEVVKERASARCRLIGQTAILEADVRRNWQKKHGSHAIGLEAEIAKARATQAAKLAFFETREAVRKKRAAFDARRISSIENERVARRFSLDRLRAESMAPHTAPWGAQLPTEDGATDSFTRMVRHGSNGGTVSPPGGSRMGSPLGVRAGTQQPAPAPTNSTVTTAARAPEEKSSNGKPAHPLRRARSASGFFSRWRFKRM